MPFPIATAQAGMAQAFADVCLTQSGPATVPVPYPNIANLPQVQPGTVCPKVTIVKQFVLTEKSIIPMSSGNEAAQSGVMSGMIKGPAKFKKVSAKVKIDGAGVAYHSCPVGHNGSSPNAQGIHCQPSQTKVFVNG